MIIELKGGEKKEFQSGITAFDVAKEISEGLARAALAVKINGQLADLYTVLDEDCALEIVTFRDDEGKKIYRHTTAHILAQAVWNVYPTAKLAIGPAIDNGFYYDIDFKTPINIDDLPKIEAEMNRIIKANLKVERFELSKEEAIKKMKGNEYKLELISEQPDDAIISFYRQGEFVDMCRGPHVPRTGMIKAVKLTAITGAYWRGNENNKMLTRIYGTSFDKKADLEAHLEALEEAKRRDHNKLGRELGYFMTSDVIGQGLPLLMPKGAKLFEILNRFVEDEESRRGYLRTRTPLMAKSDLYKISGHWDHYKDGMFVLGEEEKDDEVFALRPMTCPFQYTIYNNGLKSYRDLPCRYGETSTLFRNESSGEMHGLIRVRQFTISEGHIVCTPESLENEFKEALDLAMYMLKCLGLKDDVSYRFSRWDPNDRAKYIDDEEQWTYAENEMKRILDDLGIEYKEGIGEAAFYGPKLDIQIKNVHGKEDTMITLQVDMFLSERFDMSYVDENGEKVRPYIIHRTSLGCYERTMALLIEKYAGAFPLWMSPEQVRILSLTDRTADAAKAVRDALRNRGFRAEADIRSEKIGFKIREAQLEKVPYTVIIGDKEAESGMISVRRRFEGDIGTMTEQEFADMLTEEIKNSLAK